MSEELKVSIFRRLRSAGLWDKAEPERDRLMKEARALGLSKTEAQDYTYRTLEKMFLDRADDMITAQKESIDSTLNEGSPQQVADEAEQEPLQQGVGEVKQGEGVAVTLPGADEVTNVATLPPPGAKDSASGSIVGLSAIPDSWPALPSNAALSSELQWVQSSRLDVVEELPNGGVRVHLDRADRPAPSKAALGWLETSIRAYSKFVDVAAKATAAQEDEQSHARRERLAIQEIRDLLAQMQADQGPAAQ